MKRFGVAQMNEYKLMDFGWMNRDGARAVQLLGGNAVAYHESPDEKYSGEHLDRGQYVYWANTLVDAEQLAKDLAEKFPSVTYIVFESKVALRANAQPAKRSLFTEKGVVPA